MANNEVDRRGEAPFSGIIIAALIIGAIALAGGFIITGISTTYNVTNNDTGYQNIANSTNRIINVTNQTATSFFGNKTSTTQPTAVDRMIGTAYGSILVLGSVPDVFVTSVDTVGSSIGIDVSFTQLLIAGILAIIVGIALYLAVGRR